MTANAELAYNMEFTQSDFDNSATKVKTEKTVEWDNGRIRCGGSNTAITGGDAYNWDDKYVDIRIANGVPDKLTFQYAVNKDGLMGASNVEWYVKESADNATWSDKIWTAEESSTTFNSATISLQPTTRYIRLCYSGNFAGFFKKIKVTEKIEMDTPNPAVVNFGTLHVDDAIAPRTFTLNWTNLTGTVTSSDEHVTVTPENFGAIGGYQQTTTFSVSIASNEVYTYNATITLSGRGKSATVNVTGDVQKHDQTISWTQPEILDINDVIALPTASSNLTEFTFDISDESVLTYEAGAFVIHKAGTVIVTPHQAGNYKYNAATGEAKTLTINKVDPSITTPPQASTIAYPQPISASTLTGGVASVSGTFAWVADPATIKASGTYDAEPVLFTPDDQDNYNTVTLSTKLIVLAQPTVSVKASDITYPATTHESHLTLVSGSTPGTLTWTAPNVSLMPGTYPGLSVHFVPTNGNVYAEADVTTTLKVLPPTTYGTATGGCCPGSTYYYPANGQTYPVGGPYTVTLSKRNYLGGDSIVTLTVTQYTAYPDEHVYVTICNGETFIWDCDQLKTSGEYTFSGTTTHGCDSIVTLHLTVLPAITNTESMTIAFGWPSTWRGFDLSTYAIGSHVLKDTLTSSLGCDSVLILNLEVLPKGEDTYGFDSAYVCPGDTAEYMGEKMVVPGSYTFTMPNSIYGDSIITFYLRNYPVYSKKSNRVLHQGTDYKWRGRQLSGYDEGSYVIWDSLRTIHGCDSLFYLTLTILAPETQYEDVYFSICPGDTLLYKDVQYADSGLYNILVPEKSIYRGDSIVRLHLAFYETYLKKSRRIIYEGQNYRWRGRDLSTYPVGDFWESDTLQTIQGCDSIFRLHLTVNEVPTTYRYDTAYLCDGDSMRYYRDTVIFTTGDYTFYTTNYLGGDSIMKLHVETHSSFRTEQYDTIMQGDIFNWRGRELYLRPYDHYLADTFTTIYGCDSIYCLYLHVNPREYQIIEEMEVCQNASRTWRGMPVPTTEAGFFPEVLTKHFYSGYDADSVYVLNLTVNPSPVQHYYMTWRQGHQKTWYQEHFSKLAPGTYTFTSGRFLRTAQGCDSLEVMHVQVLPTTYGVEVADLCPGENFIYYGKTYTNEGTYTITIDNTYCGQDTVISGNDTLVFPNAHNAHGDSVITLYVHRRPTYDLHPEKRAEYGDIFWWKGQRYVLEVGTFIFRDTTTSIYGCDSLTTMTVIVDRAKQTITWNPDTLSVHASDSLLLQATASSGLPVTFASSSLFYAYVNEGNWLVGRVEGKATITATQVGNQNYYPAAPVQYIFDILEPLPYDALPAVSDDPSKLSAPVKLLRDGRLYILTPDGHLYDATGHVVE